MTTHAGREDGRVIAGLVARVVVLLGFAMLVPGAVALLLGNPNDASALLSGAAVAVGGGSLVRLKNRTTGTARWEHGFRTAALVWLVGAVVAALPLYLSGHYGSYLDAVFEGMAGLTTTGLTLVQDLDHLGTAMNLWRHLLHLVGGVGIALVVLTLFVRGEGQVATSNVPGSRDDRVMPNVTRAAWTVAKVVLGFACVGLPVLFVLAIVAGLDWDNALYHAVLLFTTAFTTGGFGVTSASAAFYHSATVEIVLMTLMLAGAVSYVIHLHVWRGHRREPHRSIEMRTLGASLAVIMTIVVTGLGRAGTFTDTWSMFRQGIFTAVAAHTTTGLSVAQGRLIATDWGLVAPAALVAAMAIGGTAGSTAGGIKTLRIGLITKGLVRDVRTVLLPESALVVQTYHQRRRHTLTDAHVRAAATVLLLFLFTILVGAMIPLFYGERADLTTAMFESASAVSNTGLTMGILDPSSPAPVKAVYLLQMWFGRLEFIAVFALLGSATTAMRGRP